MDEKRFGEKTAGRISKNCCSNLEQERDADIERRIFRL